MNAKDAALEAEKARELTDAPQAIRRECSPANTLTSAQ